MLVLLDNSILLVVVLLTKSLVLNIPIRFADVYVAVIVAGLTAVDTVIPVPPVSSSVIFGDVETVPVVIPKPLPTVILFVKLKYGILVIPNPFPENFVAVKVSVTNVSPVLVVVKPLPFPIIIWFAVLLIVACFVDNSVPRPIILDVAKLGICDIVKVPVVIFEASSDGICDAVNPVKLAPLPL